MTEPRSRAYGGLWRVLVRWFRVPDHAPTLPDGGDADVVAFHPDDGFLRYLKLWFWIVALAIDAAITVLYALAATGLCSQGLWIVTLLITPVVLAVLVVPDVIAYVAVHLRFDTTHYVMSDRSLRIRRGVWVIRETTITFENVQNLRISRGPVQQLFGIANLVVETAGAGGGGEGGTGANQGVIEGIADPEALRDRILPRVRASAHTGLGDEDLQPAGGGWSAAHVAVLREIRDAVAGAG